MCCLPIIRERPTIYAAYGDKSMRGAYRSIGINRNDVMTLIQMRPEGEPVQWLALASNAFNVLAPFYTGIDRTPEYLSATTGKVSTENFYWMSRMMQPWPMLLIANPCSISNVIRKRWQRKATRS